MTAHEKTYLKDYTPPAYWIDAVDLTFDLFDEEVRVTSVMRIRRNTDQAGPHTALILDAEDMQIDQVIADGMILTPEEYTLDDHHFKLARVPESFELEIKTRLTPQTNTTLEGLYRSGRTFCTQCEAEGFRRITPFPDRPDVMTRFTCIITADQKRYPTLLSNGNRVDQGDLPEGRHYVRWEDPFKKPSYLFALVAGDLACIEDTFTTASGREVTLQIYVEPENQDKCGHAMTSLKQAMRWDEERFGREYDLDLYQIVAVSDFNMGAMENKGLNIFNAKYVLARTETATDQDFMNIQAVIAHEYFHNWTGNRVTLKNWFQLSLKEGLTVFRDQEFTSDLNSRAVKRISDVVNLRTRQFPEDDGPMAHPVRPESYIEMNNFYTMTVYQKGAEVIRMIYVLLGRDAFRKGMDLYFKRFDGQAVTCEDFVRTMEDAGGIDLSRFRLWYSQSGTPRVRMERRYNADVQQLTVTLHQHTPPDHNQADKSPLHIPVRFGLLSPDGKEITPPDHTLLNLKTEKAVWTFDGVPDGSVPSVFRGFSAPVIFNSGYTTDELAFLMAHDRDPFNRWDAAQQLYFMELDTQIKGIAKGETPEIGAHLVQALDTALRDQSLDPALLARTLTLPDETQIGLRYEPVDVDAVHQALIRLKSGLARSLAPRLQETLQRCGRADPNDLTHDAMARRSLTHAVLSLTAALDTPEARQAVYDHFVSAGNMTESMAALALLCHMDTAHTDAALAAFYDRWHRDILVMNKWFSVQAAGTRPGTLDRVMKLTRHPDFTWKNPNRVRSLLGVFALNNPVVFHHADGRGYRFFADCILTLDPVNPQVTARMAGAFNSYRRYDDHRRNLMEAQLRRILDQPGLSRDVFEIVSRALA